MQIKNRYFSFLVVFSICAFLPSAQVKAQFFFPSLETLKDHKVKSIKVYQKAVYYQGGSAEERKKLQLDTTQTLYQIFYFNDFGYVDSTIYYPTETGFQRKVTYTYDGFNIVGYTSISNSGIVTDRWLLKQTEQNEFIIQSWERGNLRTSIKHNADSIMTESLFFLESDTIWNRAIRFNPENNMRVEQWRRANGTYSIETFQWFSSNGLPKTFMHTLEEKESVKAKVLCKEKEYHLDSVGNVVNIYMGRFDDPYLHYNYFDRLEKLKPFTFNEQDRFRKNELFDEIEVSSLYTFSGIELVHLYELKYDYW